jgi:hypothetical protein
MRFLATFLAVFMFVCVSAQRMSDAETFFNQGHYREASPAIPLPIIAISKIMSHQLMIFLDYD